MKMQKILHILFMAFMCLTTAATAIDLVKTLQKFIYLERVFIIVSMDLAFLGTQAALSP